MSPEQRAIFLQSQAACALIEMEAMKAANWMREMKGETIAYGEEAFMDLISTYGIHHNQALLTLRGAE